MGIESYMIASNATNHTYYYAITEDPPVDTILKRECGCYMREKIYDSDRCWVTYTTIETYHYLCPAHMEKHQTAIELERQEKERLEKEWEDRHEKAKLTAVHERHKISDTFSKLKISRLRKVVTICTEHGWKCSIHRGYITVTYYGREDKCVGSTVYHNVHFEYKRQGNKYTFTFFKKNKYSAVYT